MTNIELANTIRQRIGSDPVPFESLHSLAYQIYDELSGPHEEFEDVYEILLSILYLLQHRGYITFTSNIDGSTVGLASNDANAHKLYYSLDKVNWNDFHQGDAITLAQGQELYVRGKWYELSDNDATQFNITGDVEVSGNINNLLDYETADVYKSSFVLPEGCFFYLFAYCYGLTKADKLILPSKVLSESCYYEMFFYCTALVKAPELPATTLAQDCYSQMFEYCSSLTKAPSILPATTLAYGCYYGMFARCTSLTKAPELPAATLAIICCSAMFANCSSLTKAPSILPATTLAYGCYSSMFYNCTSLTKAPELPAATLARNCYLSMFKDCTQLNYVKCLATDISALDCTDNWLDGVSETGTFVKDASMSSWTSGSSGIPSGWTVQDA